MDGGSEEAAEQERSQDGGATSVSRGACHRLAAAHAV